MEEDAGNEEEEKLRWRMWLLTAAAEEKAWDLRQIERQSDLSIIAFTIFLKNFLMFFPNWIKLHRAFRDLELYCLYNYDIISAIPVKKKLLLWRSGPGLPFSTSISFIKFNWIYVFIILFYWLIFLKINMFILKNYIMINKYHYLYIIN